MVNSEPHLSLTPPVEKNSDNPDSGKPGCVCVSSLDDAEKDAWLLDSGTIDRIMFDPEDFTQIPLP